MLALIKTNSPPKLSYLGKKHFFNPQIHEFYLGYDGDVLMWAVRTMATFYFFFFYLKTPQRTQ